MLYEFHKLNTPFLCVLSPAGTPMLWTYPAAPLRKSKNCFPSHMKHLSQTNTQSLSPLPVTSSYNLTYVSKQTRIQKKHHLNS